MNKLNKNKYWFKHDNKISKILIITGPRSVGKTTLSRQFLNVGIDSLDLDDLVNDELGKTFIRGEKTPLEQAMELKKYSLIEKIVRDIANNFEKLTCTTTIAFAGGGLYRI